MVHHRMNPSGPRSASVGDSDRTARVSSARITCTAVWPVRMAQQTVTVQWSVGGVHVVL